MKGKTLLALGGAILGVLATTILVSSAGAAPRPAATAGARVSTHTLVEHWAALQGSRGRAVTQARKFLRSAGATANQMSCIGGTVTADPSPAPPTIQTCTITAPGGSCLQRSTDPVVEQTCIFDQSATTDRNKQAIVIQIADQATAGPNGEQDAIQKVQIDQANAGFSNGAAIGQFVGQRLGHHYTDDQENDDDDATDDRRSIATGTVTQRQDAQQSVNVNQNTANGAGQAGNNTADVFQSQRQRERAKNTATIHQFQNTDFRSNDCLVLNNALDDQFANACYTVVQTSTNGKNTSKLGQDYLQFQRARNATAGQQRQGMDDHPSNGGLDHRFFQSSTTPETQLSGQLERQIQHRTNTSPGFLFSQHGPTRKGAGTQVATANSTATIKQASVQFSTGPGSGAQTNILAAQCTSTGNCTATQSVNQNGVVTQNSASGNSIFPVTACGDVSVLPEGGGGGGDDRRSFLRALAGSCVPTPVFGGGGSANPNCVIAQDRSINGDQSSQITFDNQSGRPVDVWWLDYDGNYVHYNTLSSEGENSSYLQYTWITHPWVITDASEGGGGQCLGYTISTQPSQTYVIQPPPSSGPS
jgi:hypothetical protein